MRTINTNTLLDAINKQDSAFIDDAIKKGVSLQHFCRENVLYITSKGLEFLHNSYKIKLSFSIFSLSYMDEKQLEICLKYGCKIPDEAILDFSFRIGLKEFKLLFKYNIPIPDEIVLHWTDDEYIPALTYYLQHKGNPNIRPFTIKEQYQSNNKKISVFLQLSNRSLIDEWYYKMGDCEMVNLLKQYGGRLSPNAITKQEEENENIIYVSDKHCYIEIKKRQLNNIENEYKAKQNALDSETDKEYRLAIRHLKNEIKLINDLL